MRPALWILAVTIGAAGTAGAGGLPTAEGYNGIWYSNQPTGDEFVYKYSGGMATYPQQQSPIAVYAKAVHRTFFCYGGAPPGKQDLLYMVSYYDHKTRTVPRPRILMRKGTDDAHDNPVMAIDGRGHIWIFGNSHGTARPSPIFRSREPYSIDEFEKVWEGNFSYGHARWLPEGGFFFLHTRYENRGRSLYWMTSPDGASWGEPRLLARVELGHYQITAQHGARVATAFNYHPDPAGLNYRSNLYYLETPELGRTWTTAAGQAVNVPVTSPDNPALVYNSRADGLLVFLKNIDFDAEGRPVILYLTTKGWEPGPRHGLRQWWTARWDGSRWEIRPFTTSDHNYDFGTLSIEPDGEWRIVAPTDPGPQPYTTGGDMVLWSSRDQGRSWSRVRRLTRAARYNHTYARKPVAAQPDFYWLWADGDTLKPSDSRLYFATRDGDVFRLPPVMKAKAARPERVR